MNKYYVIKTNSIPLKYYAGYYHGQDGMFIGECSIFDIPKKPLRWRTKQGAEKALERVKANQEYQYLTDNGVNYWEVEEIVNE